MEIILIIFVIWVIYSVVKDGKKSKQSFSSHQNYSRTSFQRRPKLNEKQLNIDSLTLGDEQQKIFDIIESENNHVFITGKAGTGKSSLLQYFKYKSKKRLVVVAPTGVAALNVGGQTIHSLFRIPPEFISQEKLKRHRINQKTAFLLRNIDAVVVDEISMVRADVMDAIDHILRTARDNDLPFGGAQLIMFGDLYQLSPIVDDPELHKYFIHNHGGHYFFNAHVWKNAPMDKYELMHIFRQKEASFKDILNGIRHKSISNELLAELNKRVDCQAPEKGTIMLATTNHTVNQINSLKLSQLSDKVFTYQAIISGELDKAAFPTEEFLHLKKGAQVMFLKNDKDKSKRWVNGTLGVIESLSETEIYVNIDGFVYPVIQETWNKIRYSYNAYERKVEEEIVSSFTQFPLRLAWAITVHKSQGQTYGSVIVDMGEGAFAHGQTYVALSRCQNFEGLYLKRKIVFDDIIIDPPVVEFMRSAKIMPSGA